jgi:hypothetical protein
MSFDFGYHFGFRGLSPHPARDIVREFRQRVLEDSGEFEAIECLIQTLQNEFI